MALVSQLRRPVFEAAPVSGGGGTPTGLWVNPADTGPRFTPTHSFPAANDGPHGVRVDTAFLNANMGAPWLTFENGVPVISGAEILERALNLAVRVILRDCIVSSPTRVQPTWSNLGDKNNAPVVLVDGDDTIVEYCELYGSGDDGERTVNGTVVPGDGTGIAARGVRLAGANSVIRYNNIHGVRGAVQGFRDCDFDYNYCHDFSYGLDPFRVGNTAANGNPDEVTHNNAVNNIGYQNFRARYNYIDARYGTVSTYPPNHTPSPLSPFAWGFFHGPTGREVEVGDPIDGFTFTNYLIQADGTGYEAIGNYTIGSFRPFRCNSSNNWPNGTLVADITNNVFDEHQFAFAFSPLFDDQDGNGVIIGSCNIRYDGGVPTVMASDAFSPPNVHGTSGCDISAIISGGQQSDGPPPVDAPWYVSFPIGDDVTTPQFVSGVADDSATVYRVRLTDETNNLVWNGTSWFPGVGQTDRYWFPATYDATSETWTSDDAFPLPQNGEDIRVQVRRY